MVEVTI